MEKFYKKVKDKIQCLACNRFCLIEEGKVGYCKVRQNENGKLKLLTYGKPCSIALDPIEKKPLYHFYPGSKTLSFATYGCNFSCLHCQNYSISKEFLERQIEKTPYVNPEEVVQLTKENNSRIISATYTEPTVFVEYALDIAKEAKKQDMKNVWVTNGYFSEYTFKRIYKYIDAMNIDLKGDSIFYKNICDNVNIEHIKSNIELAYNAKIHLEITNLLIPNQNTNNIQIKEICEFIASIDKNIPIHFSAFYPMYKQNNLLQTNKETLIKAKNIAEKSKLKRIYLGNI